MTAEAQNRDSDLRLAELLAALSLVTDLARGRPTEEAVRACLIATRIAETLGLGRDETSHVYYMTLLRFVGCTAPSHEYTAALGGDHVVSRGQGDMSDMTKVGEALAFLATFSSGLPAWRRPTAFVAALARVPNVGKDGIRADCEVAVRMARRFQLDERVAESLYQSFERWDGHGPPRGLVGEAIALPARLAAVAFAAAMFHRAGGPEAAVEAVRRWSGRSLDPGLADAFLGRSDELLEAIENEDVWPAVLAAEPTPWRQVRGARIDEVARGFADFVDLKSPYLQGHSAGVAALTEGAARASNLPDEEVTALRRAALLHDLGRAGVTTAIWEKRGPLTSGEWEQVRLHAYHTERILSRSAALAPLAQLAGMHHERLDGSGYHRGAPASVQSKMARILAAADVYQALTEERPHRAALAPEPAARALEAQPGLDRQAVAAVLAAAGQRRGRVPMPWAAGLSDREVEVLRLLARGRSERQIAEALFISASTVHTHVTHIYEKAAVSTRASAALFAMENGLLEA
jgi:HD-GYP domain-containing protein (c-di-GMP phosphodiesterase class II)